MSLNLTLENLTCASCVARAELALQAVPGVSNARVNLATGQALVEGNAAPTSLASALDAAGYPARVDTADFEVEGMSCASCVGRIERALGGLPGVTRVVANVATGRVKVQRLDGALAEDDLRTAFDSAGYPAVAVAGGAARKDESAALRRNAVLAAALTLPVFVLEMGSHMVPAFHMFVQVNLGQTTSWVLQFLLTTLVLLGPGVGFFRRGVPALLRGAPDMNTLVALGTAAAWCYSTLALFAPGLFPEGTRAVYFEAAAVICTLILLGRWFEARARGRAGAAIAQLAGLAPRTAWRVQADGAVEEIALGSVAVGDVLQVRPGARVPVDGAVMEGHGYVDESMVSGEPIPVEKAPGAALIGGTVNGTGLLTMRATAVGDGTVLAQVARMVSDAQGAKLPIQALVDRVTGVFVPVVMTVALATVLAWLAFGAGPAMALVAGVSVLIVACPCAMGLATPTSILVGSGRAAELGVLFRQGDALQALQGARVVALDKTGTVTQGRPEVTALELAPGATRAEVLALASAVEAGSEHPIAHAIRRAAEAKDVTRPLAQGFRSVTGLGARAVVEGREVLVGSGRFVEGEGVELGQLHPGLARVAEAGRSPVVVAAGGTALAVVGVDDPVKPGARAAIAALREMGLHVALVTGDAEAPARAVAAQVGIDHVVAECLPGAKVEAVQALRAARGAVAFVGDGINDAPALAEAETGLAIGTGTDIAMESADVVLMSGALEGVVQAVALSRATMRNIRQNLFWAFAYNTALIPVAAGVLYPVAGVLLSPMLAAGAMALSSIFVLGNALRLRGVARGQAAPELQGTLPKVQPAE